MHLIWALEGILGYDRSWLRSVGIQFPVLVTYVQDTVGDGWSFIILRIRGGIPCFEEVMPIRGGHQPESGSLSHGHDSWNSGYRPHDWSICRTALPDDRPCRRGERPQAPEHLCPLIVALPPPT